MRKRSLPLSDVSNDPPGAPPARRARKTLSIGAIQFRAGIENPDEALRRRAVTNQFTISRAQFDARERRFVDLEGNRYTVPRVDDEAYRMRVRGGDVEEIDPETGLPPPVGQVEADDGSRGTGYGTVLLYARKRRGSELVSLPRGDIQLREMRTQRLYTGRVREAMFHRRMKSGHVIVDDFVAFGALTNPRRFTRRASKNEQQQ